MALMRLSYVSYAVLCMLLGEIHVAAAASSSSLRSITALGVSAVTDAMHDDASRGISTLV